MMQNIIIGILSLSTGILLWLIYKKGASDEKIRANNKALKERDVINKSSRENQKKLDDELVSRRAAVRSHVRTKTKGAKGKSTS